MRILTSMNDGSDFLLEIFELSLTAKKRWTMDGILSIVLDEVGFGLRYVDSENIVVPTMERVTGIMAIVETDEINASEICHMVVSLNLIMTEHMITHNKEQRVA